MRLSPAINRFFRVAPILLCIFLFPHPNQAQGSDSDLADRSGKTPKTGALPALSLKERAAAPLREVKNTLGAGVEEGLWLPNYDMNRLYADGGVKTPLGYFDANYVRNTGRYTSYSLPLNLAAFGDFGQNPWRNYSVDIFSVGWGVNSDARPTETGEPGQSRSFVLHAQARYTTGGGKTDDFGDAGTRDLARQNLLAAFALRLRQGALKDFRISARLRYDMFTSNLVTPYGTGKTAFLYSEKVDERYLTLESEVLIPINSSWDAQIGLNIANTLEKSHQFNPEIPATDPRFRIFAYPDYDTPAIQYDIPLGLKYYGESGATGAGLILTLGSTAGSVAAIELNPLSSIGAYIEHRVYKQSPRDDMVFGARFKCLDGRTRFTTFNFRDTHVLSPGILGTSREDLNSYILEIYFKSGLLEASLDMSATDRNFHALPSYFTRSASFATNGRSPVDLYNRWTETWVGGRISYIFMDALEIRGSLHIGQATGEGFGFTAHFSDMTRFGLGAAWKF